MKATIRFAKKTDLKKMAALANLSFPGLNVTEDTFTKNHRHKLSDVLVAVYDNDVVGLLIIPKFKTYICGKLIPMAGIGLVTMSPAFRRRGLASALMKKAVSEMHKKGFPISMLYPFSHLYYNKFGYGVIEEQMIFNFGLSSLTQYDELLNVRLLKPADMKGVNSAYETSSKQAAFRLSRDSKQWKAVFRNRNVVVYDENGIEGYIAYNYDHDPKKVDQFMIIHEMVYTSDRAFRGLLGFLAAQGEQAQSAIMCLKKDNPIHWALKEPRRTRGDGRVKGDRYVASMRSELMLRIVNLKKALLARSNYNNQDFSLGLKLSDRVIDENTSPVTFTVKNGKPDVQEGIHAKTVIECDISIFSQVYGGVDATYLEKLQLLKCSNPAKLDAVNAVFKLPPADIFPSDAF